MSDYELPEQVHAVVRDDLVAFAPNRIPPFATLQARKRRRAMRRAGTLLCSTALAVTAVVYVPAALGGGGDGADDPGLASRPISSPCERLLDDERFAGMRLVEAGSNGFGLRRWLCFYADARVRTADASRATPVAVLRVEVNDGKATSITPTTFTSPPIDPGDAGPVSRLPAGYEQSFVVRYDPKESDDDNSYRLGDVEECLKRPDVNSRSTEQTDPPTYIAQVSGAGAGFLACLRAIPGVSVTGAPVVARPPADSGRYAVGVSWRDRSAAYSDDAEAAVQRCFDDARVTERNTLTSLPPSHTGKVTGKAVADSLKACLGDGAPGAAVFVAPLPTAEQEAFLRECLGGNFGSAVPAPSYVGLAERAARAASYGPDIRVVGRDRTCLDREDDRQENRVNVVVENGIVIWAGRF